MPTLPARVDHVAIYCSDLDASIAWYARVLDLELAYHGPVGAFFDVGDTIFGLRQSREPGAPLHQQHMAFAVPDVAATHAAVTARGARVIEGPDVITEGYIVGQRFFDIAGPDGEDIEFVQRSNITVNPATLHPPQGS